MAIHAGETETVGTGPFGEPQFELRDDADAARHTLILKGELDLVCAPNLDGALQQLCTDRTEALTLDLSEITFMDSTGLRAILLAEELCEKHDCKLVLIPGSRQVQRLFEVTGLLERLPFHASNGNGIEPSTT